MGRTQLFLRASIFGCEDWKVYSDVETWLSPATDAAAAINTVKVDDVNNDFHFAKRKKTGTWINSNMFIAVWKKIKEEGLWSGRDWTVKVDVDAVFLPSRLRSYLERSNFAGTQNGIYLENCKYVTWGFFGSLEVISHNGAATYMANLDDCKGALNYLGSEKVTGNEPWGEDLFAQRCMDLTKLMPSTSTLMRLAQHGGQRARRKTGNGAPTAALQGRRQSTTSRRPKNTLIASRPLDPIR